MPRDWSHESGRATTTPEADRNGFASANLIGVEPRVVRFERVDDAQVALAQLDRPRALKHLPHLLRRYTVKTGSTHTGSYCGELLPSRLQM
jgi:hypothetical protein